MTINETKATSKIKAANRTSSGSNFFGSSFSTLECIWDWSLWDAPPWPVPF